MSAKIQRSFGWYVSSADASHSGRSPDCRKGSLPAAPGTMEGSYQMVREDGERFDAQVGPFTLAKPHSLN